MTPRLMPGPGIARPPRWEAIARREAELHRKAVTSA
jgi:phospholipid/cholesterol/gamma-HCH transport system ATP-binding protein